jgi:hypothetical protein
MTPSVSVQKAIDRTAILKTRLEALIHPSLLVGILKDDVDLKQEAYINEFGEPLLDIQASPFFIPGVEAALSNNISIMKEGAKNVLNGRDATERVLDKVGLNTKKFNVSLKLTNGVLFT